MEIIEFGGKIYIFCYCVCLNWNYNKKRKKKIRVHTKETAEMIKNKDLVIYIILLKYAMNIKVNVG